MTRRTPPRLVVWFSDFASLNFAVLQEEDGRAYVWPKAWVEKVMKR